MQAPKFATVVDVRRGGENRHLAGTPEIIEWCAANGIDPSWVYRVEIKAAGDGHVVVYEFDRTPDGKRFVRGDEAAVLEPYTVPLVTLPPRHT